jgi:hypothetical protein
VSFLGNIRIAAGTNIAPTTPAIEKGVFLPARFSPAAPQGSK